MASLGARFADPEAGADLDLDEVWGHALEEYEHTTGVSLKRNLRGFDAVAQDITDSLSQSKASNKAKAQQIVGTAAKCLQRFGGIIAQATSVVFGPSAQCWNAISFVISAAQGYQAVVDGFAALMERCVVFLERLNIDLDAKRQSGVPFDRRLRKSTYQVIAHFFTALGHSHKLATSKRQKIKTVFKIVLFNDDAGVQGALSRMETLVRDLTDTKVSVILQDVQGLARHVRESEEEINRNQEAIKAGMDRIEQGVERTETVVVQMQGELSKKMTQEESERNLRPIQMSLRLGSEEIWQERHSELSNHRIPGTGEWLLQTKTTLPSWADIRLDGVKVMTMVGDSSFGKSFLTSTVVDYLLGKYPRGSSGSERASVAYYYFQGGPDESVSKCLGSIIYQFAKSDRTYAKAVASVCGRFESLPSPDQIWRRLVADLQTLMQGTYFVVVDGFRSGLQDEHASSAFAAVIESTRSTAELCSIRLFFSAQELDSAFAVPGVATIPLGPLDRLSRPGFARTKSGQPTANADGESEGVMWNWDDLVTFTRTKLAVMCQKKPYLKPTLQDPGQNAAETLARGVKGNYSRLQLKLDQIEAGDSAQDVLSVISEAAEDPTELLLRDVEVLDDILTPDEIRELNDLLMWVCGALEPCTLKFLKAALGDKTLWLEKHIPQKFYQLLRWDEGSGVVETPQSKETMAALQVGGDETSEDDLAPRRRQPTEVALQENEIELVQRVVKTFCGDALFDRFGFQAFFKSKAVKRNVRIEVPNKVTMHARILRRSLQSLCQDQSDAFLKPLREYAVLNFMEHLRLVDLNVADRGDLRAIGDLLFTLLSDDAAIQTLFTPEEALFIDSNWIMDGEYCEDVLQCLKHPLVEVGYNSTTRRSHGLRDRLKASSGGCEVLCCVAESLAKKWYKSIRTNALYFWWSYYITAKIRGLPVSDETIPDMPDLQVYLDWARYLPDVDISQSQWSFRTASILLICGHDKEALDTCLGVEGEGSEEWPVLLMTAECYSALSNPREALEYLHRAKALRGKLLETDPEYAKSYWFNLLTQEAQIYGELEDLDAAEACLRSIMSDAPPSDAVQAREVAAEYLFKLWDGRKAYSSVIGLLRQWAQITGSLESAANWLLRSAEEDYANNCLLSAAIDQQAHLEISGLYEQACSAANPKKQQYGLSRLRSWNALILAHSAVGEHRARAFEIWQDIIETSSEDSQSYWPAYHTIGALCKHLLDDAVMDGLSPMSQIALEHAQQLESLSKLNLPAVREAQRGNDDPRLALARLHVLAGQSAEAKAVVLDRLTGIFDLWPDSSSAAELIQRYGRLAQTFNVLGQDQNAVAAWQLLQPVRSQSSDRPDDSVDKETTAKMSDAAAGAEQGDGTAESSAQDADPSSVAKGQGQGEMANEASENVDKNSLDDLDSLVTHSCDGCGFQWKAMGDAYACRHCLDLQLCSGCYARLEAGELSVLTCNKAHDHLYIPPFDRARWEQMSPDMMVLGDSVVSRADWLDQLRSEWGLDQAHIDERKSKMAAQMRAAKVLTRWRRTLLRVRAGTK